MYKELNKYVVIGEHNKQTWLRGTAQRCSRYEDGDFLSHNQAKNLFLLNALHNSESLYRVSLNDKDTIEKGKDDISVIVPDMLGLYHEKEVVGVKVDTGTRQGDTFARFIAASFSVREASEADDFIYYLRLLKLDNNYELFPITNYDGDGHKLLSIHIGLVEDGHIVVDLGSPDVFAKLLNSSVFNDVRYPRENVVDSMFKQAATISKISRRLEIKL